MDFRDTSSDLPPSSMIHPSDFARLEKKVDKLTDALNKLVIFEERQMNQGVRIGDLEKELAISQASLAALERKVDQWVNRGMGIWAFAVAVWTIVEFLNKSGFIKIGA